MTISGTAERQSSAGSSETGQTTSGSLRACDRCRRRKTRCDASRASGSPCSCCRAHDVECVFTDVRMKWGPSKAYIASLENRLKGIDNLLRKLCPDRDFWHQIDLGHFPEDIPLVGKPSNAFRASLDLNLNLQPPRPSVAASAISAMASLAPISIPDEGDLTHVEIADNISKFTKDKGMDIPVFSRFIGSSSEPTLVQKAVEFRERVAGRRGVVDADANVYLNNIRKEFWNCRPWEIYEQPKYPGYTFPDEDLIQALVDLYFTHINCYFPVFHRPTFCRSLDDGLHFRDQSFGSLVLLICANGARYSTDPRVLLDGHDSRHTSGWKWFSQVETERRSYMLPATLRDLQFICLTVQFMMGTSSPGACWTLIGTGLRLAQDVGVHRRKGNSHKPSVEHEQLKRVFWVLFCMDQIAAAGLGRSCAISDENIDQDLPIDCDDEYWETPDPAEAFKQPTGKPSVIAAFISYIRLNKILALTLRSIYPINKAKKWFSMFCPGEPHHIVAELDYALNKWVDAIPEHLRWDPNCKVPLFFNQSVHLYASYRHLQIIIHRPFILSPQKYPVSASLAVCANAARASSDILDVQRRRNEPFNPYLLPCVLMTGIALLLNIWASRRTGSLSDSTGDLEDVYKCMLVLERSEKQWLTAGRFSDTLYELITLGELPYPQSTPSGADLDPKENNAISPSSVSVGISQSGSTSPGFAQDSTNPFDSGPAYPYPSLDPSAQDASTCSDSLPVDTVRLQASSDRQSPRSGHILQLLPEFFSSSELELLSPLRGLDQWSLL